MDAAEIARLREDAHKRAYGSWVLDVLDALEKAQKDAKDARALLDLAAHCLPDGAKDLREDIEAMLEQKP